MSFHKDLQCPCENIVLIKSLTKIYDSEQFYTSEPRQKKKEEEENVNVTINSPEGALNMRPHGTAVAF